MITVNVGGVPEHFNIAWHLALKNNHFEAAGINVIWQDYFGGTGEMCEGLRCGNIDMAVILTEGIVTDIINGNPSKIIQTFVETPLNWGIHVDFNSEYKTIQDLEGTTAAISRYGSGSHLMTYINAKANNWNLETGLNFKVVNNLEGAVKNLNAGTADYFMWEKYTTKPIVDAKIFRNIGNCPTPWPCFVIAVRNEFLENHSQQVKSVLNIINTITGSLKAMPDIQEVIAQQYGLDIIDVERWLETTEWSQSIISESIVSEVQEQLFDLQLIDKTWPYQNIVKNFESL